MRAESGKERTTSYFGYLTGLQESVLDDGEFVAHGVTLIKNLM